MSVWQPKKHKENDINNKKLYNGGAPQFNTPIPIYMLIKLVLYGKIIK